MLPGYKVLGGGKVFLGSQNDATSWETYYKFKGFLHPPDTPVNKLPNTSHFDWSGLDVKENVTADEQLATWAEQYLSKEHSRTFLLAVVF